MASSRAYDDVSVGQALPRQVVRLTRGDLINFAGVSGDANPIHWHDDLARLAGLPDVVAHGMLTMGIGGGYITDWLGDPGAIKEYKVRFTSFVCVGARQAAEIEYSAKVTSMDPDTRTAIIAIDTRFQGKRIFGRANVTVQLA